MNRQLLRKYKNKLKPPIFADFNYKTTSILKWIWKADLNAVNKKPSHVYSIVADGACNAAVWESGSVVTRSRHQ